MSPENGAYPLSPEERRVAILEVHLGSVHKMHVSDIAEFDGEWDALIQEHGQQHETGFSHLHEGHPDFFRDYRSPLSDEDEGDEVAGHLSSDGSSYSLSYQWPRSRVIVHVSKELDAQGARDLADSLLWFAERVDAVVWCPQHGRPRARCDRYGSTHVVPRSAGLAASSDEVAS